MTAAADQATAGPPAAAPKLRWMEPAALAGVWTHELTIFRRYWRSSSFAAVVEPTFYLLAFGAGFSTIVGAIAGYDYTDFLGTGVVATAVLFIAAFAGMYQTLIRRTFQHSYDAILAAPVDVHELVIAEVTWIATRAGVYGRAPMLVAVAFGLDLSVGMLLVPFIGFLTGLGFAFFGVWASAVVPSIDSFNYIISGLLTPLFLVAGTFFPIDQLPRWAEVAAQFNPLYHCVELVRHAVFGLQPARDVGHVAALVAFAAVMGGLAIHYMRKRLID